MPKCFEAAHTCVLACVKQAHASKKLWTFASVGSLLMQSQRIHENESMHWHQERIYNTQYDLVTGAKKKKFGSHSMPGELSSYKNLTRIEAKNNRQIEIYIVFRNVMLSGALTICFDAVCISPESAML